MRRPWIVAGIAAVAFASACGDDGPPADDASWSALLEAHPSALLSVWGTSASDVWVVGGDARDGAGPAVFHYDGAAWEQLDTGERNVDLWWVFGFENGPVFFGGSTGAILRYDGDQFERLATPGTGVVFGIWGQSPDDLWAVGGQFGGTGGFVWRNETGSFVASADVPADISTTAAVWKVTGTSADDVWMSCSLGAMLHWDGDSLEREDIGADDHSLFSVSSSAVVTVAAGGSTTNGVLYEHDGAGWASVAPTIDGPVWRGAAVTGEHAFIVGQFGAVLRRTDAGWVSEAHGLTSEGLHAAWVDPDGGVWAVGGKFDRMPTIDGVLIHRGTDVVPPIP